MKIVWPIALVLIVSSFSVFAEDIAGVPEPLTVAALLRTLLSLSIVLAVLAILVWLIKRFRLGNFQGTKKIHVLSALSIGQRERLLVVQIGDEQILLGVASGNVSMLRVLPENLEENPDNSLRSKKSSKHVNRLHTIQDLEKS